MNTGDRGVDLEWLKTLRKEELPEKYHELFEFLRDGNDAYKINALIPDEDQAFRVVIALATYFNGQHWYWTHLDSLIAKKKREYVIEHRGEKVSKLVRITGWSERTIYNILEAAAVKSSQLDLYAENREEQRGAA